jgi:hypothetical protein
VQLLLLLLTELLHELLDFSALLGVVVPRVMHWAPHSSIVTTGHLTEALVIVQASTPHKPLQQQQ